MDQRGLVELAGQNPIHHPALIIGEGGWWLGRQAGERIAHLRHALDAGQPLLHQTVERAGGELQLADEM